MKGTIMCIMNTTDIMMDYYFFAYIPHSTKEIMCLLFLALVVPFLLVVFQATIKRCKDKQDLQYEEKCKNDSDSDEPDHKVIISNTRWFLVLLEAIVVMTGLNEVEQFGVA